MKQRPGKVIRTVYATETPEQKESTEIISHEDYNKLRKEKVVSQKNPEPPAVASEGNPEEKKASGNDYYVAFVQDADSPASLATANNVAPSSIEKEVDKVMVDVRRAAKKNKSEKASPERPVTPPSRGGGKGGGGPALVSPSGKLIKEPVRCILEIRRDAKRRANKLVPYWLRKRERRLKAEREKVDAS